jgi:hypothetical protein
VSRGVFAVDRRLWRHTFFKDEAHTEREAWLWLISEAAWKTRLTKPVREVVTLQRAELAHSLRFMAQAWGWKEPRVRRFLRRLKSNAMIDTRIDADVTVITVCNYDKYQYAVSGSDAPFDAGSHAPATQTRRTKKYGFKEEGALGSAGPLRNVMEGKKEDYAFKGSTFSVTRDQFNKWKAAYSAISDLRVELQSIDDHLVDYPEKIKDGKWRHVVSRLLAKANGWRNTETRNTGISEPHWEFRGDTVRVYRNDPRWQRLEARYHQEQGRTLDFAEFWPFPALWVREIGAPAPDRVN